MAIITRFDGNVGDKVQSIILLSMIHNELFVVRTRSIYIKINVNAILIDFTIHDSLFSTHEFIVRVNTYLHKTCFQVPNKNF
jgi:hypothetical protein